MLPSCLASMKFAGHDNNLKLPTVRSSVIVLVDGLGLKNLRDVSAHARFLTSKISGEITTVFPSTTAAGLATLVTGSHPGSHGIVGYRIKDPDTGDMINQLTGLDLLTHPGSWMQMPSLLSSQNITSFFVGHPRFEMSALSKVLYPGVSFASAYTLEDRISRCLELVREGSNLVLLYISELDEIAHKHGVESTQWATKLEDVDSALRQLDRGLPSGVGVLVTADHGVIDIPASNHVLYGEDASLLEGVAEIGGEPRCVQLYLETSGADLLPVLQQRWHAAYGHVASVLTRDEIIVTGLLGEVTKEAYGRLGNLFVLAKENVVFYDARDSQRSGQSMIGQHGAVSAQEMNIPDIRLGAYSAN